MDKRKVQLQEAIASALAEKVKLAKETAEFLRLFILGFLQYIDYPLHAAEFIPTKQFLSPDDKWGSLSVHQMRGSDGEVSVASHIPLGEIEIETEFFGRKIGEQFVVTAFGISGVLTPHDAAARNTFFERIIEEIPRRFVK